MIEFNPEYSFGNSDLDVLDAKQIHQRESQTTTESVPEQCKENIDSVCSQERENMYTLLQNEHVN